MDVCKVHQQLLADYEAFTSGFTKIYDPWIRAHIEHRLADGGQWPDAYLSLNPNFASGGSIIELERRTLADYPQPPHLTMRILDRWCTSSRFR